MVEQPKPRPSSDAPKLPEASPDPVPTVAVLAAPPEILVERTRWHPTPQKRTARVLVAGVLHEVREGDIVGELLVGEIRPSSIEFIHEGVRIERKLGS